MALHRRALIHTCLALKERTTKRIHPKRNSNVKTGYSDRLYSTGLTILGLTSGERRALLELEPLLATSSASLQRLVEDDMD